MTKHILVIANKASKYYLGTIEVLSKYYPNLSQKECNK